MTIKLVTARDETSASIPVTLREIADMAERDPMVAMAVVLVRADGASWVSTLGRGNRVLLLGAVTDLQFTIARDGDKL